MPDSTFIADPSPDDRKKWGILAHVTPQERGRIMALPAIDRKVAIKSVEMELARRRRQAWR